MTQQTIRPVADIGRISRDRDAEDVALAAYARLLDLLVRLRPADWNAPTECTGWDVAAMVGHLIGAAKACASPRELIRQQAWGFRHAREFDGNALDAANHLQVRDQASLSPAQRIDCLRTVASEAVRGRMRLPTPLRRVSVGLAASGSTAPGSPRRLRLGDLMDVVYTRDVWLHTIDIVRATGRSYVPSPDIDGRVVEDVVAEWANRHGRPVVLTLTGPAGGRFRQGSGHHLELDAIEFCRILSGRAAADPVLGSSPAGTQFGTRVVF